MKLNVSMRRNPSSARAVPANCQRVPMAMGYQSWNRFWWPDYNESRIVVSSMVNCSGQGPEYQWNAEAARQVKRWFRILDFRDDYSSHYF